MTIELKLNTDSEGFISQECPECGHRFKVKLGDGSPRPVTYCPYCRHKNRESWWTGPQASYIESAAGVSEGGRTGLTSVVVAILFFGTLFLGSLAGTIPSPKDKASQRPCNQLDRWCPISRPPSGIRTARPWASIQFGPWSARTPSPRGTM